MLVALLVSVSFGLLQPTDRAVAATATSQLTINEVSTGKTITLEIQQTTEQSCPELPSVSTGVTVCSFGFQYRLVSGDITVLNLVVLAENGTEIGYLSSSIVLPGPNWSSTTAYAKISTTQNVRLALSASDSRYVQTSTPLATVKLTPKSAPKPFTMKPKFPSSVTQYNTTSVTTGSGKEVMQYAVPLKMNSTATCVSIPFQASPIDWDSGQPEDQNGAKYHEIKVQIWNSSGKQVAKGGIVGGIDLWSPVSTSTTFSVKACGISAKKGSKTTFDVVIDAGARLISGCCTARSTFKLQITKK